ncbi:YdcF family protein [Smaragdicoccus niigatensis]|uniref:YdcF family protein n=2 Tax=Smaragdicoccus niigatensis TaxID=359359 RepID=UPI000369BE38
MIGLVIEAPTTGSLPGIFAVAAEDDAAGLYNQAQQKFTNREAAGGLAALQQMLALTPNNADALALQAIWSEQLDDTGTRDAALSRLAQVDSAKAQTARNVIDGVNFAAAIVPSTQPVPADSSMAIVILGFGLLDDGSMRPELVSRLSTGLLQANTVPDIPIVVTGGNPKRGISEGAAMQKWLLDQGVPESRILVEDKAPSTVGNAQNSTALLQQRGISKVVLVTSPNHIRRAAADFAGAGTKVVGTVTTDTDLAASLTPYTREQQAGIRLEATRAAAFPVTKTAEQVVEAAPELPTPDAVNAAPTPGSKETTTETVPESSPGLLDDLIATGSLR